MTNQNPENKNKTPDKNQDKSRTEQQRRDEALKNKEQPERNRDR